MSKLTDQRSAPGGPGREEGRADKADECLDQRLEVMTSLMDAVGSLVVMVDTRGHIVGFNKACEQLTGYSFAEVRGRLLWDLMLAPEEVDLVRKEFATVLSGPLPKSFENYWVSKDGRRHWIAWSNTAFCDGRGEVEYVVGTGIDITERKVAEEDLRYQLRLTRAIMDQATDSIFVTDEIGRILFLNAKAERAFGFDAVESRGQLLHDLVHRQPDGNRCECHLQKVFGTGEAQRPWEDLFLCKDGSPVTVECTNSPLEMEGKRTGTLLVVQDTTVQKQVQMELNRRGLQQAAVAELGERALLGGDLNALLKEAAVLVTSTLNVEYCTVLEALPDGEGFLLKEGSGWRSEIIGRIMPPDCGASYTLASSQPVVTRDLARERRFRIAPLFLDHRIVSSVKVVIAGLQRPFGVIGAHSTRSRDFTRDDIHFLQAIANVLAMVIRRKALEREVLEISETERRRFAQDLHDGVCQHFTGIGMMALVLERKLAAKGLPETTQAREISRLLCDGSDLAREVMEGLSPVNIENGGLIAALSGLAGMIEKRFGLRCRFIHECDAAIHDSFIAGHLLRIAQEAVDNAVKHSQAKSISITLTSDGSHLVLSIRDNGVGLPAQTSDAKGMGLQVIRYRASLINASLSVTSAGRRGTLVTCSISVPNP